MNNKPLVITGNGQETRDFNWVKNTTQGFILAAEKKEAIGETFNIGSGKSIPLKKFIKLIEKNLNIKAKLNFLPLQTGDVIKTYANIRKIRDYSNYKPRFNIDKGVEIFIKWYKDYYNV